MRGEDEDSESDLWARQPTRHRKKHKMLEKNGIEALSHTEKRPLRYRFAILASSAGIFAFATDLWLVCTTCCVNAGGG